jgi:hypothetical protein
MVMQATASKQKRAVSDAYREQWIKYERELECMSDKRIRELIRVVALA